MPARGELPPESKGRPSRKPKEKSERTKRREFADSLIRKLPKKERDKIIADTTAEIKEKDAEKKMKKFKKEKGKLPPTP